MATLDKLSSVMWPAVVLGIALLYRAEIRDGLGRLSTVRYRGFEIGFGEALRAAGDLAKVAAEATPTPPPGSVLKELAAAPAPASPSTRDRLRRLADLSPRVAILEAWHEVESANTRAPIAEWPTPPPWEGLFERLRALRNRVASAGAGVDDHLRTDQARQYVDLAQSLIAHLRGE